MKRDRKSHFFVVRLPAVVSRKEARKYLSEAIKDFRRIYPSPELQKAAAREFTVRYSIYEMETETLMNLRKDLSRLELSAGEWERVSRLVNNYIHRGA